MKAPQLILQSSKGKLYLMESGPLITEAHRGSWVLTASHGGVNACRRAVMGKVGLAIFNDAGGGKENAGIAGLELLQAAGIAGATISHETGKIGDVDDMWEHGVFSHVNDVAARLGLAAGQPVAQTLRSKLQ